MAVFMMRYIDSVQPNLGPLQRVNVQNLHDGFHESIRCWRCVKCDVADDLSNVQGRTRTTRKNFTLSSQAHHSAASSELLSRGVMSYSKLSNLSRT